MSPYERNLLTAANASPVTVAAVLSDLMTARKGPKYRLGSSGRRSVARHSPDRSLSS